MSLLSTSLRSVTDTFSLLCTTNALLLDTSIGVLHKLLKEKRFASTLCKSVRPATWINGLHKFYQEKKRKEKKRKEKSNP